MRLGITHARSGETSAGELTAAIQSRLGQAVPVLLLHARIDKLGGAMRSLDLDARETLLSRVLERLQRFSDSAIAHVGEDFIFCGKLSCLDGESISAEVVRVLSGSYLAGGQVLEMPCFIGGAISPRDGTSADTLTRRAEIALRSALHGGVTRTQMFKPSLEEAELDALAIQNALRAALLLGEFELFYQPQSDIRRGAIIGFEALLRWRRSGHGLISPGLFIPVLESSGLILAVGEWAIRQGCAEAARWPEPLTVAVNVSPAQLANPGLPQTVFSALAHSGLSPHRLELEVTESCLIENVEGALASLRQLKAYGIGLSLDDFGTGYSSLSYLKKFPFTKLKIDQSFVREAKADDAILKAIVDIAGSLGMKTIAEGVETEEQLEIVANAGCAAIQGYLVSRPIEAKFVAALLSRGPVLHRGDFA